MSDIVYVVTSLAIVMAILGAFILLRRRMADRPAAQTRVSPMVGLWMAIGMLLGSIAGLLIWVATDTYLFWVLGLSAGMAIGLAIGVAREPRG